MDWVDYFLPSAINAVLISVKNPEKKSKWRAAFLKVFRAIKFAYPDDPDFQ